MNAVRILNEAQPMGAKEFRSRLPKILRNPTRTYRVLLQNRFAVAVLPDYQFTQLLEMIQELQNAGLLRRLLKDSKRKYPWFWSERWQKRHRAALANAKSGRTRKASSVDELLAELNE